MTSERDEQANVAARVGATVDKYQLLRVLGTGGMGAVYEAQHRITGKRVALKMMHTDLQGDSASTERFLREARAASQIGHPSIVDVLDAGELQGSGVYLVLELLDGVLLSAAVERRQLPLADILQVGVQVLEALDAAHVRGIVHRDIKPDNVFLTRDGRNRLRVKLLDFGLAKHVQAEPSFNSTQAGTILGTPYYMSPEQARGEAVDHRADLFSVGALMYFALTGGPPFEGQTYAQLLVRILTAEPAPLSERCPHLPAAIERWIEKAMAKTPEQRFQTASEMADALRRAGAEVSQGYLGVPPSVLPPPSRELSILEAIDSETRDLQATVAATPLAHASSGSSAAARPAAGPLGTKTSWVRESKASTPPSRRWMLWAGLGVVLLAAAAGAVALASSDPSAEPASPPTTEPRSTRAPSSSSPLDLEERPNLPVPAPEPVPEPAPVAAVSPAATATPQPVGTARTEATSSDAGARTRASRSGATEATRPERRPRRGGDRLAPVTEYE